MARKKNPEVPATTGLPADYASVLDSLKVRVQQAQTRAMLSVNRALIQLYWDIGRLIVERQENEGWGKGVVDRLAADVQKAFPGMGGFSRPNVFRMRALYLAYRPEIIPQAVGQSGKTKLRRKVSQPVTQLPPPAPPEAIARIPWGHNQVLLFKLKDRTERLWYAAKALEHGWSRAVLTVQIESGLYARQGKAVTNFAATLPAPQCRRMANPTGRFIAGPVEGEFAEHRGNRSGTRIGGNAVNAVLAQVEKKMAGYLKELGL